MRSIIKDGVLLEASEQAPSPSKDFVNMKITIDQFMWHYWKINPSCLKSDVRLAPTEVKESHADLLNDYDMQTEIKRFFGANMLQYVKDLCSGHYDYFPRLKKSLQIYIMSFMELEDIGRLAQTSKHFRELCNSEQLWEHIVESHCDTITPDMRMFAGEVGWKHVFFTNKLQLQAQMRRHQRRALFVAKLSDTNIQ